MPSAKANGIELEYDSFGAPAGQPLLLINGLGMQMVAWEVEFCELLAEAGPFHVIRFDNRDCGLSTRFDERGVPDVMGVMTGQASPAYTIEDMADDAAGLLDALGIKGANVVGFSMGGAIAQTLAITHPSKVLSLTSISSGPGGIREDERSTPEAAAVLFKTPPDDREGLIDHGVELVRVLQGSDYFDEVEARKARTRAVDRSVNAAGTARQLGAVFASAARDKEEELGRLHVPTLIIHGEIDPLVPVAAGRRTAAAIAGTRLLLFPLMGHGLPKQLWPEITTAIAENARRSTTLKT